MQEPFGIKTEQEFSELCIETFLFQYHQVEVYKKFVDALNIDIDKVLSIEKIPFLPIEMFKHHKVIDKNYAPELFFQSSGTTQQNLSKHWIADEILYQKSIYESFSQFIGKPEDFIFLGLLPNYLERKNASLIYMVDFLMKKSSKRENGYFLYDHLKLYELLSSLASENKKIILFGVSFALLDFLDTLEVNGLNLCPNKNLYIIETGGMKGRKEEMTKDALLEILKNRFSSQNIFSEYSMTELLSQAYSLGNNIYESPSWMRILIRDTEDPFNYCPIGKTGGINIIDLANRHSCSFIATQDLGKLLSKKEDNILRHTPFQVLGRIDHSDIRGCSLLVS
ncbi:LuxE/PaaK family acyltransferase [Riemerella columbipharyngis]|uniref:Acyl-protein synthetase, LuxE n=1 Tax=Riemerella columbipharyngis TaxID=1071918 RepID=A0A1G7B8A9_9FLAO|nr:acyl transferase [Riemerella columbipharyngis]SDE22546.1 Acyl-protein synthetase, LuxE [Riemerella columbipharyngis]